MNVNTTVQKLPVVHVKMDLDEKETKELERYMSEHTGVQAPDSYKELLVSLRKAIDEFKA